jgi:hypothetical protein
MTMDAKDLIQKAWVLEVAWLLLTYTAALFFCPVDRLKLFLEALPLLTYLIGGQGILAAAGPEVKRLIESRGQGGGG